MFFPPEPLVAGAHIKNLPGYHRAYDRSTQEPDQFWLEIARELHFQTFSGQGLEYNFDIRKGPIFTRFLSGSTTNISYNCLERMIELGKGNKTAYKWIGNEPGDQRSITYSELHQQVVNFSAVLRSKGVRKGEVVAIYMPMILEVVVAMLGNTILHFKLVDRRFSLCQNRQPPFGCVWRIFSGISFSENHAGEMQGVDNCRCCFSGS